MRILFSALALSACCAQAASPGLQRTIVGHEDVSVAGREAVVAKVELSPGATSGRHTHPGDEISYVLDGEAKLFIDGASPRAVEAGESFVVPAGKIHELRNESGSPVHLVGVYVVDKGQPLATPAK